MNNSNNNNNNNDKEFESIKGSIDQLKKKRQENNNNNSIIDFKSLNSKPTIATGMIFGASAFYYSLKGKKQLSSLSIAAAAILLVSGHFIDKGYEKEGAILAGGTSALLAGSTLAGAFKYKKFAPLFLGSLSFISMGYHAFFTLYNNNIDKASQTIQLHNDNIKSSTSESK